MKPVFVLDGARFDDLDGLFREFSEAVLRGGHTWNGHLDALNDILRGGFGTPVGGFVLQWINSAKSRHDLKDQFAVIVAIIRDHGPGGDEPEDNIDLVLA